MALWTSYAVKKIAIPEPKPRNSRYSALRSFAGPANRTFAPGADNGITGTAMCSTVRSAATEAPGVSSRALAPCRSAQES